MASFEQLTIQNSGITLPMYRQSSGGKRGQATCQSHTASNKLRLGSESRLSTTTLGCKQRSQAGGFTTVMRLSKPFLRRNRSGSLGVSLSTLLFTCVFTHSKTLWKKQLLSWRLLLISDPCYRTREESRDRGLTTWLNS